MHSMRVLHTHLHFELEPRNERLAVLLQQQRAL
jgi:hypothetical protein